MSPCIALPAIIISLLCVVPPMGLFLGTEVSTFYGPIELFPTVFVQIMLDSIGIQCQTHQSPMESDGVQQNPVESSGTNVI